MFIVGFLFEKLASEHWFLQVSCLCGGASLLSNIGCLFGSGVGMGRVLSKALLRGGRFGHGEQDGCGSEFVIGDFLDRRHLDRHFHSLPLSALRDIRGCRRAEKSLIDTETGTHQVGIGLGKGYFTFFFFSLPVTHAAILERGGSAQHGDQVRHTTTCLTTPIFSFVDTTQHHARLRRTMGPACDKRESQAPPFWEDTSHSKGTDGIAGSLREARSCSPTRPSQTRVPPIFFHRHHTAPRHLCATPLHGD